MDYLISIIVPIYNVEKYLNRTIESLLNQTYKNLEILLIDDGSIDSSPRICDLYKEIDSRIIVVHKENRGVAEARNTGINMASGDFICFVDSDDYVDQCTIECLLKAYYETKSDIVMNSIIRENQEGLVFENIILPNKIFSRKEALKELVRDNTMRDYLWNKMYKRELFDNIEFPKNKIYEDVMTVYKLFYKANHITTIDQCLYHYLDRNNSIVNSNNGLKTQALYNAYMTKLNEIEKIYPDLGNLCNYQKIIHEINYYTEKSNETKQNFKELKEKIKKHKNNIISTHDYNKKELFKYILMVYFTRIFIILRNRKISQIKEK